MKDDKLYPIHIGECIARIQRYVVDGRESFMASTMIQDAVLRNLQLIGESSHRLPDSIKATHPEVNWRGIVALRNILVHEYFGVNLDRVWEVVQGYLPDLKRSIDIILQELEESS